MLSMIVLCIVAFDVVALVIDVFIVFGIVLVICVAPFISFLVIDVVVVGTVVGADGFVDVFIVCMAVFGGVVVVHVAM